MSRVTKCLWTRLESLDIVCMDCGNIFFLADRSFLGAVPKLRKATVSSCLPVRMEQLSSHRTDFHENLISVDFFPPEICRERSFFKLKFDLTWRAAYICDYLAEFVLQWDMWYRQAGRPQMAISCDAEKMRFACRISRARIHTCTQNM
jgi:hypothetical protein